MKSFGRQFGWANFSAHFRAAAIRMPAHRRASSGPWCCNWWMSHAVARSTHRYFALSSFQCPGTCGFLALFPAGGGPAFRNVSRYVS